MMKFRVGNTPTWGGYWFPHVVFPGYLSFRVGCLGFWALGYKLEVEWNFTKTKNKE